MATLAITAITGSVNTSFSSSISRLAKDNFNPLTTIESNFKNITKLWKTKRLPDKLSGRIKDLSVQSSAYGEPIPILYGTSRIAGNIIWSTDIKEVVTSSTSTSQTGGKGSQTVTQTTKNYSYFASMAIAICEGEVTSLNKVWANTELLDLSTITYRFYKGTETQTVDSLIEANKGVGNTPAYRGLSYIVFENFPLAEYGNSIPNFTFEVNRKVLNTSGETPLESLITSVIMIPGSGEFVYDTEVQNKLRGRSIEGIFVPSGTKIRINQNNNSDKADALVSLDQAQEVLTNLEWVAPVISWYGDNLDIASCTIEPRVEYKHTDLMAGQYVTSPDHWSVNGLARSNANVISMDENDDPNYGGTISDNSLIRYLVECKSRNLKVMFYPLVMMDVTDKPWRGRLNGASSDVSTFFTKTGGYNEFIMYYANLIKNYCDTNGVWLVDAFVIGSEMIGLTSINDGSNNFPAVTQLISLTASVKALFGSNVKVTYAADWSEYHHTTDGWYNLDPLWASNNIDMVGIDAYFPLTDTEDTDNISKQDMIDGWTSGEGYDWYYTDEERTTKANLDPSMAWKNIAWWWSNTHTNPDSNPTSWTPESKKIWFTEYGFPSVDGASNQPNVFYNPDSSESAFPRFSKGRVDFLTQRKGLQATEEQWLNSTMIENKFVWTWDARPYPFFPDLKYKWNDYPLWKYGHWINGKLGVSLLSSIVAELCDKSGLSSSEYDADELYDIVEGFVVNNKMSIRGAIEALQKGYFFDIVESDGVVKFVLRKSDEVVEIDGEELV